MPSNIEAVEDFAPEQLQTFSEDGQVSSASDILDGDREQQQVADFNDDSDCLQDLLEEAGFTKTDIEMINEHNFSREDHFIKVQRLIWKNPQAFFFEEMQDHPAPSEYETGFLVARKESKSYILASINTSQKLVIDSDLREVVLSCFHDREFDQQQ